MSVQSSHQRYPERPRQTGLELVFLVVVVCALGVATPTLAQESDAAETTVDATDEQARLNDQGVRAISEEDYVKAISLLEEAKYLGELNITYLNLGRAYQLAGRCTKAREALEQVDDAPKVKKPPAGLIESKADEYLSVLDATCDEPTTSATEPTESKATPSPTSTRPAGIAMTSAGAATMLGAVGMHVLWAESIRNDATSGLSTDEVVTNTSQRDFYDARSRANNIDTAALITGVAGGIVTGVGLYFWLSDTGTESASRIQLTPSTDGVRATWTVNF